MLSIVVLFVHVEYESFEAGSGFENLMTYCVSFVCLYLGAKHRIIPVWVSFLGSVASRLISMASNEEPHGCILSNLLVNCKHGGLFLAMARRSFRI